MQAADLEKARARADEMIRKVHKAGTRDEKARMVVLAMESGASPTRLAQAMGVTPAWVHQLAARGRVLLGR